MNIIKDIIKSVFRNCSTNNSLLHVGKLKVMHLWVWVSQYCFNILKTNHIYMIGGNNSNDDIH